nr:hypothetical protein [Tanacetum cinerariifolium]
METVAVNSGVVWWRYGGCCHGGAGAAGELVWGDGGGVTTVVVVSVFVAVARDSGGEKGRVRESDILDRVDRSEGNKFGFAGKTGGGGGGGRPAVAAAGGEY